VRNHKDVNTADSRRGRRILKEPVQGDRYLKSQSKEIALSLQEQEKALVRLVRCYLLRLKQVLHHLCKAYHIEKWVSAVRWDRCPARAMRALESKCSPLSAEREKAGITKTRNIKSVPTKRQFSSNFSRLADAVMRVTLL
jgi:hypothetical protein